MKAEILTIGDELCRGEIVDTNAAWLAARLWDLEVTCAWMSSCGDVAEDIADSVRRACGRVDLVICSGGLGPTEDDLTVDVVADVDGVAPEVHEPSRARMAARLAAAAAVRPAANTMRQVRVPAGALALDNPAGAAPGFEVAIGGVPVICLPGVPREMKAIFDASVRARVVSLRDRAGRPSERVARRVYRVFGRGELTIAEAIADVVAGEIGASLHYQVSFPETLVKLVVRDASAPAAAARLDRLDAELRGRLGTWLYGDGDDSMAAALGRGLAARGLRMATAESCTGGLVGALVTAVPGSSAWYVGGAVCYADAEKVRQLGVAPATLAAEGAVSEACVREMAAGIRARTGADVGVAVSGVAGPGGGSADKPVGTVWLAVAGPADGAMRTRRLMWPGEREPIRMLAAWWAMAMVLRAVAQEEPDAG